MAKSTVTSPLHRSAAAASIVMVGALAGCSSGETGAGGTDQGGSAPSATESADAAAQDPGAAGDEATYADGTYTATGGYISPNGPEEVEVTLTLSSGVVAEVDVASLATNPNSEFYQGEFIGGIADVVVGVPIDELEVDRVAGSSLTSGGFNEAVEIIKGEASA
ncbi:FMN-binding protein [Serinibacter salmoneus]|uniref:FMN-binding protein n=1 Tax=Serinibacter salmoneus TaxID=556530 RepID=A0A2A9CXF8_9MICO|nr:FMN-binding protein [Serinibacter salmoneus]PFG18695.1 hypothetical protein ATL40_0238 [Serinibacter salmoneus]